MRIFAWALVAFFYSLLSGCGNENPVATIASADLKNPWPLTVEPVKVYCFKRTYLVVEAPDGKRYALIGGGSPTATSNGWLDKKEIWKADERPDMKGLRIDIGELHSRALDSCVAAKQFS
jgi:hypothetical protein